MKKTGGPRRAAIVFLAAAALSVPLCGMGRSAARPAPAETPAEHVVRRVSDGDTLVLDDGEKVRLIGVDTPETHDDARNAANAARRRLDAAVVRAYASRAKQFVESQVRDRRVRLEYDWQRKDKFGRTLAYVYLLPDDVFLNAEIVKQGYGFAYTRFPFKYADDFRRYEREAREERRGLWESAPS